jgi:predicted O-methyltransferase YrrM
MNMTDPLFQSVLDEYNVRAKREAEIWSNSASQDILRTRDQFLLQGPIDFVLLDLWKELYVPCFERFLPKLDENGIIAADNMPEPEVVRPYAEAYRAAVRAVTSLQSVLLPIGQGVELSCVWRAAPAIGGL